MRKLLLLVVVALLGGAALYYVLSAMQGYLVLSIGSYIIETTLWGALVAIVLFFVSCYIIFQAVRITTLPRSWWRARLGKKKLKVRGKTAEGIVDYLEGNWPSAVQNLTSGVKHSEMPSVNYLGAAAASFNLGDEESCQSLITKAEDAGVVDSVTGGLLRSQILLQKSEFDKALALLDVLHRKSPSHPTVLRLMVAARKGVADWHGLELLFADLKKYKALSVEELEILEEEVYRQILNAFSDTKSANKTVKEQQAELDHLWETIPRKLQGSVALIAAYVAQLQQLGLAEKAEVRLRRVINKQWSDPLVRTYGYIEADASSQLKIAETWLKRQPDNPSLLETLGRLCVRCELWGKGKEYFEMSLKTNPQPATWLELGDLMQKLGDGKAGAECFRNGLQASIKN